MKAASSRTMRLPLKRKFPPKLNHEQLRQKANEEMASHGIKNHYQCIYNSEVAKIVAKSNDPLFAPIKPAPKPCHRTKAWKIALEFCFNYLREFELKETESIVHLEMSYTGEPKSTGYFSKYNREEYFDKITTTARKGKKPIEERLAEFRKQQALAPPPELSLDPVSNSPRSKTMSEAISEEGASTRERNLEALQSDSSRNSTHSHRSNHSTSSRRSKRSTSTKPDISGEVVESTNTYTESEVDNTNQPRASTVEDIDIESASSSRRSRKSSKSTTRSQKGESESSAIDPIEEPEERPELMDRPAEYHSQVSTSSTRRKRVLAPATITYSDSEAVTAPLTEDPPIPTYSSDFSESDSRDKLAKVVPQKEEENSTYSTQKDEAQSEKSKEPKKEEEKKSDDDYYYSDDKSPKESEEKKDKEEKKSDDGYYYSEEPKNGAEEKKTEEDSMLESYSTQQSPDKTTKKTEDDSMLESPDTKKDYSYSYSTQQSPEKDSKKTEDSMLESYSTQPSPEKKPEETQGSNIDTGEYYSDEEPVVKKETPKNEESAEYYSDEEPVKKPESVLKETPKKAEESSDYYYSDEEPVVKKEVPKKEESDEYYSDDEEPVKATPAPAKKEEDEDEYEYEYSDEPAKPAAAVPAKNNDDDDYEYTYDD